MKKYFGKNTYKSNYEFIDSSIINNDTFNDYLYRLRKIALSIFEWKNLPSSMNERALELSLYRYGMASLLKDKNYRFYKYKLLFIR